MHTGQEQERIGQEYIGQGHERIGQEQERIGQEQNAQLMAKTARGSVSGGRAGDERSGDSADLECGGLVVNTQRYAFVVVPGTRYIRAAFARAVPALRRAGTRVLFIDRYPEVLLGEHGETIRLNGAAMNRDSAEQVTPDAEILRAMREASEVLPLSELIPALRNEGLREVRIAPESPWIRIYHYEEQDGSAVLMFVNEGTDVYRGSVDIRACFAGAWEGRKVDDGAGEQRRGMSAGGNADDGGVKENGGNAAVFWYDAWENETHPAEAVGSCVELTIEPRKSRFLILDRGSRREHGGWNGDDTGGGADDRPEKGRRSRRKGETLPGRRRDGRMDDRIFCRQTERCAGEGLPASTVEAPTCSQHRVPGFWP